MEKIPEACESLQITTEVGTETKVQASRDTELSDLRQEMDKMKNRIDKEFMKLKHSLNTAINETQYNQALVMKILTQRGAPADGADPKNGVNTRNGADTRDDGAAPAIAVLYPGIGAISTTGEAMFKTVAT